jgi:hypothetical protein
MSTGKNPQTSNSLADLAARSTTGICQGCSTSTFLMPLHGEKGGPLRCPLCVGKWNAEHGRKRRLGRIVIRAIAAFMDAGGSKADLCKLQLSATGISLDFFGQSLDPLGYLADSASTNKGEIIELTSELLADAIKLAHPDCHPPERQDLAHRTTQGLLALQPFVFPAPKPKPSLWERYGSSTTADTEMPVKKAPDYPCADCKSATPYFYCNACRAEWEKRQRQEQERENAKQRKRYAARRARRWRSKACESCGATFNARKHKRKDARFCSDSCRQRAHRKTVTDKSTSPRGHLKNRDSGVSPRLPPDPLLPISPNNNRWRPVMSSKQFTAKKESPAASGPPGRSILGLSNHKDRLPAEQEKRS